MMEKLAELKVLIEARLSELMKNDAPQAFAGIHGI